MPEQREEKQDQEKRGKANQGEGRETLDTSCHAISKIHLVQTVFFLPVLLFFASFASLRLDFFPCFFGLAFLRVLRAFAVRPFSQPSPGAAAFPGTLAVAVLPG